MARVPLAQGPQVDRTPLQGGYLNPVDVSAPARQAAHIASNIGGALERQAMRDAEAQANDADFKITRDWLDWDAQARQKYRGQTVGEYEVEARKWWDKASEDYGKELSPLARERVGTALGRKRNSAIASVLSHVNGEREKFADESAAGAITTTIQFGVTNNDPAGAAQRVRQIAAEIGARKGWTTEQVQAEQQRNVGQLHIAMVSKLANADAEKAGAYYHDAKSRGEIPVSAQARIEEVLKAEGDSQFASKFAASMATKPFAEQMAEAAKIDDPARRDKVMQRVKEQEGLRAAEQAGREKRFSDQAWQMVGQGARVPESVLAGMDGRERVQLQDYLRQRAEHMANKGREAVKTDPLELSRLLDMQARDPEAFKAVRMEAYAYKISGSDLEQLARSQRELLNPKPDKDVVSFNNKVTARIEMMGATGERHAAQRGQFRLAAQKEFERAVAANGGKALKPEDEDKVLDRLLLEGKGWFGPGPASEADTYAESVATGKKFVPKISSGDRKMIVEALKSEGIAKPTDDQVLARFKLAKGIK